MGNRAVAVAVGVSVLVLALVSPALAQGPIDESFLDDIPWEATSDQIEFCDAAAGVCQYGTLLDNEDNAGSGGPDNDMGQDGGGGWYTTCTGQAKHPVEFNIAVSAVTYNVDAWLALLVAPGSDAGNIKRVRFNGEEVTEQLLGGAYPGGNMMWAGHLDPKQVHAGNNRVMVQLRSERCVSVAVGFLLMSDRVEWNPEFVPEPGSIALLGSGLVSMAGYAALRHRSG